MSCFVNLTFGNTIETFPFSDIFHLFSVYGKDNGPKQVSKAKMLCGVPIAYRKILGCWEESVVNHKMHAEVLDFLPEELFEVMRM